MGAERTICRDLRKLDRPRFVPFLLLLLKMSWTGFRRRGLYFEEERNQEMPQRVSLYSGLWLIRLWLIRSSV
jgi:hypothetical protein